MGVQQVFFILILAIVTFVCFRSYGKIVRAIQLGKSRKISGDSASRWKNVLLIAFGQKKMFKRPVAALLHLCVYIAFLITQIELIEILADGLLGHHRIFGPHLGSFYTFVISFIEFLSVAAFVATIAFLARRNILRLPRFHKAEMKKWPVLDANIILLAEIVLIIGIFSMNSADMALQSIGMEGYHKTGTFLFSSFLSPVLLENFSPDSLIFIERAGWWLHIMVVFGFLMYLPFSKHLHIMLAFPNTYFASLESRGRMKNIPEVTKEIKLMLGQSVDSDEPESEEIPEFGSKDITDLSWKNILDAYTCTECGRCTAVCPANITGKKLSPRKIVMDVRDRAEEIEYNISKNKTAYIDSSVGGEVLTKENYNDGKSLFDLISHEELHACTTCNACVEACPVLIDPLDVILQMRRYEILTASAGPSEWIPMFTAIENNGAVWQMSDSREAWKEV